MANRDLVWALAFAVLAFNSAGCSSKTKFANFDDTIEPADAGSGAEQDAAPMIDTGATDGPPAADASGYCGNSFFKSVQNPPNLYFVLDRSGSMQSSAGNTSRYEAIVSASVNLVKTLGSRAKIGAAVFPGDPYTDECGPGQEVFSTVLGDDTGLPTGPVTKAFAAAINVYPIGGTPIASTLEVIRPTLSALSGKTVVILATDGGPNCNSTNPCSAKDCIWCVEGTVMANHQCSSSFNCCDPSLVSSTTPVYQGCLDAADTVAAVQVLRNSGIRTFIVGIPGSGPYASILDQLAVIGGTALATEPKYYRVDDVAKLSSILSVIGNQALITCEFTLDSAPPQKDLVNVYLDQDIVTYDETNGWAWTGAQSLSLRGTACQKLESGAYKQVQVVAGCPTELPK